MKLIEEPDEFPPCRYRVALTVGDHSPRHLRRIARSYLRLWSMPQLTDVVELVLTEMVTNVYRHVPDRWCTVTLLRTDEGVRIEVYDRSPAAPAHRFADEWDETGRGLALISQLTDKWEVLPEAVGKLTCCELKAD
ncbi:ATP-binding protein [Streptomyces ovatisporus]|uniref:ATP-binding protein n=1 Tax=Streptomyces ovatisporus TaxID=1128682 RepID=A0ABV8ZZY2_9ACTN